MTLHAKFIRRSGSDSSQRGRIIEEIWDVQDSVAGFCNLGPLNVMANSGVPKRGAPYVPQNACDTSSTELVVENVEVGEPHEVNGGFCGVEVKVTYAEQQPTNQSQRPVPYPHLNTSQDPIDWVPTIDIGSASRSVVSPRLFFVGAYQNDPTRIDADPCQPSKPAITYSGVVNQLYTYTKDSWQPYANTVGDMFEPTAELSTSDIVIVIQKNVSSWPGAVCWAGTAVNNASVRIKFDEWNYDATYGIHSLKVMQITGKPEYREWYDNAGVKQSRTYWPVRWELHYRPSGWYHDRDNTGFNHIRVGISQNLPDGNGGTNSYNDYKDGSSRTGPIRSMGDPISHAVHLGLDGQVLAAGQQPWTMRYVDGIPKNFQAMPIPGVLP